MEMKEAYEILNKIDKELLVEIVAAEILEMNYDEIKDKKNYKIDEDGVISFDDVKYTGKVKVNGCVIPDNISIFFIVDEYLYVHSINSQIASQILKDISDERIKELGLFHKRGGLIFNKRIKVILNFLDLYDVYLDDKLVENNLYNDEILMAVTNLRINHGL